MHHDDQQSMHQPSGSMQIDPLLYYPGYHQQPPPPPPPRLPPHLAHTPTNYSSPSSQGSDTQGSPPNTLLHSVLPSASSSPGGKRPGPSTQLDRRKKARVDDDPASATERGDKDESGKPKSTRGSRACMVCRRLKMKCSGGENGPPCKRCQAGGHECIFEESNRGKRSTKKHEILSRSIKKMERTLDTVLRSIGNPALTAGLTSRSASPSSDAARPSGSGSSGPLAGIPSHHAPVNLLNQSPSPRPSVSPLPGREVVNRLQQPPDSPKLHSLPDNTLNPLGLLAEASLANTKFMPRPSTENNVNVGVASRNYFKPGPMTMLPLRRLVIERQVQPEMLTFVSTEEVVALFNIYFEHLHVHANVLDPNFHSPSLVCSRSPFLLTTICSIASKFYTAKPELHPKLTELAKQLAFSVPARGYKSVEIVQAYLLLALWGCGAVERFEMDKTWMLLGMGIRMATDLNLHRKSTIVSADTQNGKALDMEIHNRERTWILCFVLDRSFSSQMGKPHTIREDYIIRHVKEFYSSPVANESDIAISGYVQLQQLVSHCLEFLYSGTDSPSGLQRKLDYMQIIKSFDAQLRSWWTEWVELRTWHAEHFRTIAEFYLNYAILVLNSFGLQDALERKRINIPYFVSRVYTAAHRCAIVVRDRVGPSGNLKYAPDSTFVQISYAVLSLLKLIRPELQPFLNSEKDIINLVKDVADTLSKAAANPQHTPSLYSNFLRALIAAKLDLPSTQSVSEPRPSGCSESSNINVTTTPAAASSDMERDKPAANGATHHHRHQRGLSTEHQRPSSSFLQQQQQQLSQQQSQPQEPTVMSMLNEYQFISEMGPVADISTFPPTMAPVNQAEDNMGASLTMEDVLSSVFWDSMVVPGFNSLDGLSGGFVFGAGGSGLITPHYAGSPAESGANSPSVRGYANHQPGFPQTHLMDVFDGIGHSVPGVERGELSGEVH